MSAAPESRPSPGARAIVWLFKRMLWSWPMVPATWVGRALVGKPARALRMAAPLLFVIAAVVFIRHGVVGQHWGWAVATAWHNEQVARKNVEIADKFLRERAREKPERVYDWQKRSLGDAWYAQHQQERRGWEEAQADAERVRADNRASIPSAFSLLAPEQPFSSAAWAWEIFYNVHHVLLGTVYPPVLLLYLISGILQAWRGADRRSPRRWRAALAQQNKDRLLLGLDDRGDAHFLSEAQRSQHLLVTGASGFGKTQALTHLVVADIAAGRGLVFVDLKGDRKLARTFYELSVQAGRGDDFRFFSFEPGPSDSYNPISAGDALAKTDRTFAVGTFGSEEHYRILSREALLRVLSAMERRGGTITFLDLVYALFDRQGYRLVSSWADPDDLRQFEEDLLNWDAFQNAVSGLRANLKTFSSDALRERLCRADASIDLSRAHAGNHIVYFELNSQMRPDAARALARLVLEDVKGLAGALATCPEKKKSFHVYVDEAGRALYPGLAELISQCRSAEIGLVLATQSPRDFDGQEVQVMTQVLQNTATKIVLRQPDPESASLCAELGGTRETMSRTYQMVDEGLLMGVQSSGVYSDRNVHEFAVHPSTLKNLGVGSAFVLLSDGTRAVVKMPYNGFTPSVPFEPCRMRRAQAGVPKPLNLRGLLRDAPPAAAPAAPSKRSIEPSFVESPLVEPPPVEPALIEPALVEPSPVESAPAGPLRPKIKWAFPKRQRDDDGEKTSPRGTR